MGGGGKVYVKVEGLPGVIRASATNLGGLAAVIADPNRAPRPQPLERGPRQADGRTRHSWLPVSSRIKPTRVRWASGSSTAGRATRRRRTDAGREVDRGRAHREADDQGLPRAGSEGQNFAAITATVLRVGGRVQPAGRPELEGRTGEEGGAGETGVRPPARGRGVYVRRTLPNGQVNEFTLSAAVKLSPLETVNLVQTVSKSRLDLLDRTLPSFSDNAAVAAHGDAGRTTTSWRRTRSPTRDEGTAVAVRRAGRAEGSGGRRSRGAMTC